MKEASLLCTIPLFGAEKTHIKFDFDVMDVQTLAERGEADFAIFSSEDGFSPLGAEREFFEKDLGLSYDDEIRPLANWNLSINEQVSLVSFRTRNRRGLLKGLTLAPGENCRSYAPYASYYSNHAHQGRPHRDYYYSISYQAIVHACIELGARRIAISHLSGSGRFHADMATCHAEALMHFCKEFPDYAPESFIFYGCCISPNQLIEAKALVESNPDSHHRPIKVLETFNGSARLVNIQLVSK
jgi:hypothetical protein